MKKKVVFALLFIFMTAIFCSCSKKTPGNTERDEYNGQSDSEADNYIGSTDSKDDNISKETVQPSNEEAANNSVIKLYCESSSMLKVVIKDEHVVEFRKKMQENGGTDAQFFIEFFNVRNDSRSVYAKMQIFKDYAQFISEERINEVYDNSGEPVSADSLWGYYSDFLNAKNNIKIDNDELTVTFEGLGISKKINVEDLQYELGYMADSYVALEEKAVAQVLVSDNSLASGDSNSASLFHVNSDYIYDDSVELIVHSREFADYVTAGNDGAYIRFYKSKEDYENDRYDLYVSVGSYDYDIFFKPYSAVVLQKTGTDERFYKDEITYNPVYVEGGTLGIKLRDSDLKSSIAGYGYFKIVTDYNNVILSGTMDDACTWDYSMAYGDIPELPDEYADASDDEFFKPISRFFRVYSKEYPTIVLHNYDWSLVTDDDHKTPVYAYGPNEFYESSCKVTYLEAVDPYGDIVQSLAKNSFAGENDLLFAYCGKYYFPIDVIGRDEATFDEFPESFFHDEMVSMLGVDGIEECLTGYTERVLYMDFTEKYKTENKSYDERYGANNYWSGRYGLVPARTKYVLPFWDEGFDDKTIEKLDRDGNLAGLFSYQFNLEDPWSGNSNYFTRELTGTSSGYSTIGALSE